MTPVGRLNVYIYTHDLHVDNFTAYFVYDDIGLILGFLAITGFLF